MNEKFIQYIWFQKLFYPEQQTIFGESVEIISVGTPNSDAGPDVFNARVKIGTHEWVGNVEFHVNASDWRIHEHHLDISYENVILHVVACGDEQIYNNNGTPIPTIVLRYPEHIDETYREIEQQKQQKPLKQNEISTSKCIVVAHPEQLDTQRTNIWLERLLIERINHKSERIETLLERYTNDWEQVLFITLARNFGFHTNSDALEALALTTPINVIRHHRNNLMQIEALLLGQAGFLDNISTPTDEESNMIREYNFLKNKFSLRPLEKSIFKNMRIRPGSFPAIRIAQLAALLYQHDNLVSMIIDCTNIKQLHKILAPKTSEYWSTHYLIGKTNKDKHSAKLSIDSLNKLIINTVVPFQYTYYKKSNNPERAELAIDLLYKIPFENNKKTRQFHGITLTQKSAATSQALIELQTNYCEKKECTKCQLALQIIKSRG